MFSVLLLTVEYRCVDTYLHIFMRTFEIRIQTKKNQQYQLSFSLLMKMEELRGVLSASWLVDDSTAEHSTDLILFIVSETISHQ